MPAGLQVWGPDGSMWLDTNTKFARLYGQTIVVAGQTNVWMAGLGTPFAIQPQPSSVSWSDDRGNNYSTPLTAGMSFTNGGNTLNVNFSFTGGQANPQTQVIYGAF